jgi:hypothetical protein
MWEKQMSPSEKEVVISSKIGTGRGMGEGTSANAATF